VMVTRQASGAAVQLVGMGRLTNGARPEGIEDDGSLGTGFYRSHEAVRTA
jgi:hypothetical protein